MRISTKGRGIIRAQQGAVARPNPKENYKLPEDQRYQAQTRGMKNFAIEWYKERAKQPKYQSQVNESNLANMFTLYVNVSQGGLQHFSLNKDTHQKWIASTLSNS